MLIGYILLSYQVNVNSTGRENYCLVKKSQPCYFPMETLCGMGLWKKVRDPELNSQQQAHFGKCQPGWYPIHQLIKGAVWYGATQDRCDLDQDDGQVAVALRNRIWIG
jgi:hypothetical protein